MMSSTQPQMTKHSKRENVTQNQGINQLLEVGPEMRELADSDFKTTMKITIKDLKDNMNTMRCMTVTFQDSL